MGDRGLWSFQVGLNMWRCFTLNIWIYLNLSSFFSFLHFRHRMWMYDTISLTRVSSFQLTTFYLWFVCVFGDFGNRKSGWEWVRVCSSVYMCVCASGQGCRFSSYYFVLFYHSPVLYHYCVELCHPIFKDPNIFLLPSLWYLLWDSFLHKSPAFCSEPAQSQRKCCIPDFMVCSPQTSRESFHWVLLLF